MNDAVYNRKSPLETSIEEQLDAAHRAAEDAGYRLVLPHEEITLPGPRPREVMVMGPENGPDADRVLDDILALVQKGYKVHIVPPGTPIRVLEAE